MMVVTPPDAAAMVALAKPSQSVRPARERRARSARGRAGEGNRVNSAENEASSPGSLQWTWALGT